MTDVWTASVAWLAGVLVLAVSGTGCSAVHSGAIRDLIDRQAEHIEAAKRDAGAFRQATELRIAANHSALADLEAVLRDLERADALRAMQLPGAETLALVTGDRARSLAHLAGRLYLERENRLIETVRGQFEQDFATLALLAGQIEDSWARLSDLQGVVNVYAAHSALQNLDARVLHALVDETGASGTEVEEIIERSRQVNQWLQHLTGQGTVPVQGGIGTFMNDLVELLQAISAR